MFKTNIYFIAATGTDLGKTYLVEKILKNIPNAKAVKPIISGFDFDDPNSDSAKILKAQNIEFNNSNLEKISPWRFKDPVSAHFAGEAENSEIDFDDVVKFCTREIELAKQGNYPLFIEGAGGVCSPITYEKTFLDLAKSLDVNVLLLGANYLGSISHILSAFQCLKVYGVNVEKIIINEELPNIVPQKNDIIKTIENFTKVDTMLIQNFVAQLN